MSTTTVTYTAQEVEAHRKEWVAALRSGQFKQGHGVLSNGEEYCCLGVACVLAGIEADPTPYGDDEPYRLYFDNEPLVLPQRGQDWLGVDEGNPNIDAPRWLRIDTQDGDPWPADVATLNDDGFTFNQIADLVEYFGFGPAGVE